MNGLPDGELTDQVIVPLPLVGIPTPSPPRITQPPGKLFQKPKAGVRAVVFPARGWVPVGVNTAISAVSEKSFVSCSKKRGVNEISPNPEWLFVVVVARIVGVDDRQAGDGIVPDMKGTLMISSRRRFSGARACRNRGRRCPSGPG